MLRVLYPPALLSISRYCTPQWPYGLPAGGDRGGGAGGAGAPVRKAATAERLALAGEAGVRAFAVLLPSLFVHYLARVDIAAGHGAAVRDQQCSCCSSRPVHE
ncbi:MAG: hypothetical protein U0Z44_08080 [Kouleothrix sp.]